MADLLLLAVSDYPPKAGYAQVLYTIGALVVFAVVMTLLTFSVGAFDRWLYAGRHHRRRRQPEVNARRDITVWEQLDDQGDDRGGWELAEARRGGEDR